MSQEGKHPRLFLCGVIAQQHGEVRAARAHLCRDVTPQRRSSNYIRRRSEHHVHVHIVMSWPDRGLAVRSRFHMHVCSVMSLCGGTSAIMSL